MAYAVKPTDYPGLKLYVDGVWGAGTYGATQTYLKRMGFYPKNYLIDGVYGHGTRTAIQKYLRYRG
ncbi:peptidoglycan-binding domain-containing protein, partial [Glutamicibacter sp. AOP12-B1-11]|uniref:peptidoglycan-binding domain-containing protein n=1 Tax=Glutamicibacter sp. AOP12-B1-11 TaxID=3457725 RepID=UPI004033D4EF